MNVAKIDLAYSLEIDEVIDAMKEIGDLLPPSLRETSKAGLAVTPTGIKITEDIIK